MRQRINLLAVTALVAVLQPLVAQAHFLWLVRTNDGGKSQLHMYFGELAEADDPDLLDRVSHAKVRQVAPGGKLKELELVKGSDSLVAQLGDHAKSSMFVVAHDLGVMTRGDDTFRLRYYGKTGPVLGDKAWKAIDCGKQLALDLVPQRVEDRVQITVRWNGTPVVGAEVKAYGPGMEDFEATSDENGLASFSIGDEGLYSIRARHVEDKAGSSNGNQYTQTRHYSTLALTVGKAGADKVTKDSERTPDLRVSADKYPVIPELVTSFGAAIVDDALYIYGGHTGDAHSYSAEAQARTLRRLDLTHPKAWEAVAEGPGTQGLALIAHGGKLYRIGGFTAKNKEGEEHDLWSQADVACFDPATEQWSDMSPLPEPRSSFDAAVLGDSIYVVGGWKMAGEADAVWHKTAYVLDLAGEAKDWKALPEPPFQRRALSLAAHTGKIYVIGGMQEKGGPTTRVDIFDPARGKWSEGPSLQGEKMDGFGSSAFATGGRLYATTYSGKLQQLSLDGSSWEVIGELERARFFHRMLPLSETQLLSLGGASMSEGKFEEVDVIEVK